MLKDFNQTQYMHYVNFGEMLAYATELRIKSDDAERLVRKGNECSVIFERKHDIKPNIGYDTEDCRTVNVESFHVDQHGLYLPRKPLYVNIGTAKKECTICERLERLRGIHKNMLTLLKNTAVPVTSFAQDGVYKIHLIKIAKISSSLHGSVTRNNRARERIERMLQAQHRKTPKQGGFEYRTTHIEADSAIPPKLVFEIDVIDPVRVNVDKLNGMLSKFNGTEYAIEREDLPDVLIEQWYDD